MLSSPSTTDEQLIRYSKRHGIHLNNVIFKDELCELFPHKGGYVINMANSNQHGTHWVSLYLHSPKNVYYFDSFGILPPLEIRNFVLKFGCHSLFSNTKQIQSINSGYCGSYCMDFLTYMTRIPNKRTAWRLFINQFC